MKIFKIGIQNIILVGLTSLLAVSCSKDDSYEQVAPKRLELQTAIAGTYSIDKQYFLHGDAIGIYLVDFIDGQPGVLGDIANSSKNIKHTLQDNKWIADPEREIFLYSNTSDVYAYFPYDREMGSVSGKRNLAAYPFSVKSNQQAAMSESDFLWAKAAGLSNTSNQANLTFEHLLSKMVVNLHHNDVLVDDLKFKIHNVETSCIINLRNGDVTNAGNKQIVSPGKNTEIEVGYDEKYEAILVPQIINAGIPLFSINIDGNTLVYILEQDLELLTHKSYVFNLTIGEAKRSMKSSSIQLLSLETKSFE